MTDRVSPTAALAVAIPAILVLAALPFLRIGDGTGVPQLSVFLGRFHPTLLHLPVALLLLALLLETTRLPWLVRLTPSFPPIVLDSVLWLAALSGFAAAVAGWLLSHLGGYDDGLLDRHLWSGVATAIGAFVCVVLRSLAVARPDRAGVRRLATAVVFTTCGTMILGAHAGGSLTHDEDYLTEHAPAPIRRLAGLPIPRDRLLEFRTPIADRAVFDGVALRIFERHCTSCHNPGKLKGDLKLDTYDGVLTGGQSGPAVIAGAPADSELVKRLHLPLDDRKHMPPKGRTPLTDDESAVLSWWVEAGAPAVGRSGHCRRQPRSASRSRGPCRRRSGGRSRSSSSVRPPSTRPRSRPCGPAFPDRCGRSCLGSVTSSTRRRSRDRPSGMPSSRSWRRRAAI